MKHWMTEQEQENHKEAVIEVLTKMNLFNPEDSTCKVHRSELTDGITTCEVRSCVGTSLIVLDGKKILFSCWEREEWEA